MNRKILAVLLVAVACATLPTASALPEIQTTPGPDLDRVEVYADCQFNDQGLRCVVGPCVFTGYYEDGPEDGPVYNGQQRKVGVTIYYDGSASHGDQWGPYTGVDLDC